MGGARWSRRLIPLEAAAAGRARRRAARPAGVARLSPAQRARAGELQARLDQVGLSRLTDDELDELRALVARLEAPADAPAAGARR